MDVNYFRDYRKSIIHEHNYRYTRIFDSVVREGIERGYIRADLELPVFRDLFFGGLEYGMRTLMGRKTSRDKVAAYVEALVDPLWLSMQSTGITATAPAASDEAGRLEAAVNRLERVAARLDRVKN